MSSSSQRRAEPGEQGLTSPRTATVTPRGALQTAPVAALSFIDEGRDAFKSFEEKMHR